MEANMNGVLMQYDLRGKRVAILVGHGFEQIELEKPRQALTEAGALTQIVSPEKAQVRGWDEVAFGNWFDVEVPLVNATESDFDALLLPGGVMSPDKLRLIPEAVSFVRAFVRARKPVAAICHGPQLLLEAGVVRGRTLTSHPSIKTDLINARAKWVDKDVVVDHGMITSRRPADLPAFNARLLEEVSHAAHVGVPA